MVFVSLLVIHISVRIINLKHNSYYHISLGKFSKNYRKKKSTLSTANKIFGKAALTQLSDFISDTSHFVFYVLVTPANLKFCPQIILTSYLLCYALFCPKGPSSPANSHSSFDSPQALPFQRLDFHVRSCAFCVHKASCTYIHLCWCSVTQPRPAFCDPMDCSTPGFPVPHHLLEFAQVHTHCMMPPSHLIL